jgi:hypothetical protein
MIEHLDKRSGNKLYFIPQLCYRTGIDEDQKNLNFREIKNDIYPNAQQKMNQTRQLLRVFEENK